MDRCLRLLTVDLLAFVSAVDREDSSLFQTTTKSRQAVYHARYQIRKGLYKNEEKSKNPAPVNYLLKFIAKLSFSSLWDSCDRLWGHLKTHCAHICSLNCSVGTLMYILSTFLSSLILASLEMLEMLSVMKVHFFPICFSVLISPWFFDGRTSQIVVPDVILSDAWDSGSAHGHRMRRSILQVSEEDFRPRDKRWMFVVGGGEPGAGFLAWTSETCDKKVGKVGAWMWGPILDR